MSKVKFFQKEVNSQGHAVKIFGTERKVLSQGTHECVISFSSKVITKVKFTMDRQTDGGTDIQTERVIPIYPQTSFAGGIMMYFTFEDLKGKTDLNGLYLISTGEEGVNFQRLNFDPIYMNYNIL